MSGVVCIVVGCLSGFIVLVGVVMFIGIILILFLIVLFGRIIWGMFVFI